MTTYFPHRIHAAYNDFLPNVSIAYDVVDNLVFRAAYGKTITRAGLGNIASSLVFPNKFKLEATAGNPDLKPMKANNFDLGLEWYFQPKSVLSVGVFYKGVKDMISTNIQTVTYGSLGLPANSFAVTLLLSGDATPVDVTQPVNLNPLAVRGFEIFYQQPFEFLPEPFDGLGMMGNFTYTAGKASGPGTGFAANDGTVRPQQLVGLSSYTGNATVYYEKDAYSVRLSYSWRSKYPALDGNYYNTNSRQWQQARGTMDATVGYQILDNLEVRFDVTNLLNADDYVSVKNAVPGDTKYGARYSGIANDDTRQMYDYVHGRNYMLSLRGHL